MSKTELLLHTLPTPIKPAPLASPILAKPPPRVGSWVTQVNILRVIQILLFISKPICSYQEILSSKYTCDIVPSHQFHAGPSLCCLSPGPLSSSLVSLFFTSWSVFFKQLFESLF